MKPKIGLIGLTAQLYKERIPEFINNLEEFSFELKKVCEEFSSVIHFPVVYKKEQVEEAFKKIRNSDCDGVILVFLSYSPSLIISPVLKKYKDIPVLIWNTQKLFEINENFTDSDMLNNHGMHGVQDLASVLLREKTNFSLITGYYKEKQVIEKIKKWCQATSISKFLKKSKIGRIGGKFKDMGDFSIPDEKINKIIGPEIVDIPLKKLSEISLKIDKSKIEKLMKEDRKNFKIKADEKIHYVVSRIEISLRKIIEEKKLDGVAINFNSFKGQKGCEVIPFSAISKFLSEGIGYGGEGDVICAISVLIFQKLFGEGNFVEMFTTDYKNSRVCSSHMGEININMAKDKGEIEIVEKDMTIVKKGLKTLFFKFQIKPGKITLFNISPTENSFKFIVSKGEIIDIPIFEDITSPHFIFKVDRKVEDFLTEYSKLGGTHHLAMTYGDRSEEIKYLSEIMGIEYFEV